MLTKKQLKMLNDRATWLERKKVINEALDDEINDEMKKLNSNLDKVNSELDKAETNKLNLSLELDKINLELDKVNSELDKVNKIVCQIYTSLSAFANPDDMNEAWKQLIGTEDENVNKKTT